jgi:hypothetical protein
MATVRIMLGRLQVGAVGAVAGIPAPMPRASQDMTSNGTNQLSNVADVANDGVHFWRIKAVGGAIRVAIGTDPDATAAPRWTLEDGDTEEFVALDGERVAVTDA